MLASISGKDRRHSLLIWVNHHPAHVYSVVTIFYTSNFKKMDKILLKDDYGNNLRLVEEEFSNLPASFLEGSFMVSFSSWCINIKHTKVRKCHVCFKRMLIFLQGLKLKIFQCNCGIWAFNKISEGLPTTADFVLFLLRKLLHNRISSEIYRVSQCSCGRIWPQLLIIYSDISFSNWNPLI